MSVSSIDNSAANAPVGMGSSAADLSNSFMTLLVAQMQNQDPTNPMDNNQLTSQLAQFNTAAGVENLNKSVYAVGMMLDSMQQMSSASWVGREVMIEGDTSITWGGENQINAQQPLNFNLSDKADKVIVTLTDASGKKAWTAELTGAKAGINAFSLDDLQNFQPSQPEQGTEYTVTYSTSGAEGTAPTVTGLVRDKVEGVSFGPEGAVLHLLSKGTTTMKDIFVIQ